VLGGASGTTYDAFKLLGEAQKYGARVALFGRKINNSENQLAFIKFLRLIADGVVSPEEAVRAYHGVLQELKIRPYRSLEDDMQLTTPIMSYGGAASTVAMPATTKPEAPTPAAARSESEPAPRIAPSPAPPPAQSPARSEAIGDFPRLPDGTPDFDRMTIDQKIAYNKQERDRIFGWS
jgi:hypothetical protein